MCRRSGTLRSYGAASRFQPAIYKHYAALRLHYRCNTRVASAMIESFMNQRNLNEIDDEAGEPERVITSHEATVRHDGPATNRRRSILIISTALAVLLILLVFVLLVWRWRKSPAEEEKTILVVSVKVAKAERGAIAAEISAVGTIWPRDKAEVAAKVSAQIKTMALLKNKFVKAGEVIAELESKDLRAQRAEAAAAPNEARASERSLAT